MAASMAAAPRLCWTVRSPWTISGIISAALLYEREAAFLIDHEWAMTAADILERRTKHGLHLSAAQIEAFAKWLASRAQPAAKRRSA